MGNRKERAVKLVKNTYLVGMQYNFIWDMDEVKSFIRHYADLKDQGAGARETVSILAARFKRPPSEVAILILDLGDKGKISPDGSHDLNLGWKRRDRDES